MRMDGSGEGSPGGRGAGAHAGRQLFALRGDRGHGPRVLSLNGVRRVWRRRVRDRDVDRIDRMRGRPVAKREVIELQQQTVDCVKLTLGQVIGVEQGVQTLPPVRRRQDRPAQIAVQCRSHDTRNVRDVLVDQRGLERARAGEGCAVHAPLTAPDAAALGATGSDFAFSPMAHDLLYVFAGSDTPRFSGLTGVLCLERHP
jgi:hypothetical protein